MEIAIQMQNVTYQIKQKPLLYDISLEAHRGEILGILGANGSGKTTLIRLLTGQLRPFSGKVLLNGSDPVHNPSESMSRTGVILEDSSFYPYLTGLQNLRMIAGLHSEVTPEHLTYIISLFDLTRFIKRRVSTYSKGMRQRLAIAAALLHQPDILLLDEPWDGLDACGIRNLSDYLRTLAHEKNVCILLATNRLAEAERLCDRAAVLSGGRITGIYSMQELTSTADGTHAVYQFRVSDAREARQAAQLVLEEEAAVCSSQILELSLPNHDTDQLLSRLIYQFLSWGIDIYTVCPVNNRRLEEALEISHNGGGTLD